jgi:hypothetical protein
MTGARTPANTRNDDTADPPDASRRGDGSVNVNGPLPGPGG